LGLSCPNKLNIPIVNIVIKICRISWVVTASQLTQKYAKVFTSKSMQQLF
jgi:hypothetical protein